MYRWANNDRTQHETQSRMQMSGVLTWITKPRHIELYELVDRQEYCVARRLSSGHEVT
jgi:hypothetical protein